MAAASAGRWSGSSAEKARAWNEIRVRIEYELMRRFPGAITGYGDYSREWFIFDLAGRTFYAPTPEQPAYRVMHTWRQSAGAVARPGVRGCDG
ncbi:hypothetical protein Acsp04_32160 [Actinomadura sp. NBRC 104425]|uniref:hypothetical protein n=1 Tax=Actinomadura sp. NBRC 104425 TaxID=3032204 RepID=UPI0024A4FC4B|nr:hypothetical protein [Actinomadura sp. NBRC 104425]GLZ12981.1 hypothetical protein Acsp04_32160 [Actinomadura sp. NBRC 104425]